VVEPPECFQPFAAKTHGHGAVAEERQVSPRSTEKFTEDIEGRVAVIFGAVGGIGRAIAARLAVDNCRLALVDLDLRQVQSVAGSLGLTPPAHSLQADITNRQQVDAVVAAVAADLGGADILVNAAGINTRARTLADMDADDWERVIAVDLTGVFHCTQAFLGQMRQRGGGTVVTIVSTAALLTSPGAGTHYCAAKRALLSFTESINMEQGRFGIRGCSIMPGEVDTPLIDRRPQPTAPERRATMLKPGDVAEAVYYAVTRPARVTVSDIVIWPSAQISGQTIV
jgi:NAD(P)-dependent dehydrogenase (short-subunit alcohol dehydrogenase family)